MYEPVSATSSPSLDLNANRISALSKLLYDKPLSDVSNNREKASQLNSRAESRRSKKMENQADDQDDLSLEKYKISISDKIKVGFYSSDRATQTVQSEILDLKSATSNLEYLCKEIDVLKYELKFARSAAHSKFEQDLEAKSIELYTVFNEKIKDLKSQYEERNELIRRAHNSKLAAVISQYSGMTEELKNLKEAQASFRSENESQNDEQAKRIKELLRQVADKDIVIRDLQQQLLDNTDRINRSKNKAENEETMKKLLEDKENALTEARQATSKITRLENALNIKEEEYDNIMVQMGKLQIQIEKMNIHYEELNKEYQEAKTKFEREKSTMKKEFDKQKVQIETKLNQKMKDSREQLMKQQQLLNKKKEEEQEELLRQKQMEVERERLERERLRAEQDKELEEMKRLQAQQQDELEQQQMLTLAEALQREREKQDHQVDSETARRDTELIFKLRSNELALKSDILKLKRELNLNNETWEKKFEILKQNLHAIKDEMYLRQSLKKQVNSKISYASVAYTMNQAPNFLTDDKPPGSSSNKPVLPSINNNTSTNKAPERPMSFTVSIPSRLSGLIETNNDDIQIIGDEEMDRLKQDLLNDIELITPRHTAASKRDI